MRTLLAARALPRRLWEGAGTCSAGYLNAPKLETFMVEKIRERILNEETIVALVQLVAEEIDATAGELSRQAGGHRG